MSAVIEKWISCHVAVTLKATVPVTIRGLITKADGAFVELDREDEGMLLIPVAAILHITAEEPRDE
jgi:hypothetical protein